jgi:hypothetical protein
MTLKLCFLRVCGGVKMSRSEDRNYHEARSLAELQRAEEAINPSIAQLHRELSALHRRRMMEIIHLGEPQLQQVPVFHRRQLQHDF